MSWEAKTQRQRQENEANRFAIELLAPAYLMKPYLPPIRFALPLQARELWTSAWRPLPAGTSSSTSSPSPPS